MSVSRFPFSLLTLPPLSLLRPLADDFALNSVNLRNVAARSSKKKVKRSLVANLSPRILENCPRVGNRARRLASYRSVFRKKCAILASCTKENRRELCSTISTRLPSYVAAQCPSIDSFLPVLSNDYFRCTDEGWIIGKFDRLDVFVLSSGNRRNLPRILRSIRSPFETFRIYTYVPFLFGAFASNKCRTSKPITDNERA